MTSSMRRQTAMLHDIDVVRCGVNVIDLSRRNQTAAVVRAAAPSFLVKRSPSTGTSAARERWILTLLHQHDDVVAEHVPRILGHDGSVTLEYSPSSFTINTLVAEASCVPLRTAAELGKWLGALHSSATLFDCAASRLPAGDLPWALFLDRPSVEIYAASSGAALQLLEVIQEQPDICWALNGLRATWRRAALIHNDLKWDNVVVEPVSIPAGEFKVIDWELAGAGDPRWDVGSIFAAFLGLWGGSVALMQDTPPDRLLEHAKHPLDTLQPAIRAFWSSYSAATLRQAWSIHREIEPIIRFCGARLIQASFERAQQRATLSADAVILLQVAQNIIKHPLEAATQLLGLSIPQI